jgi:hypothetical protein
MYMYVHLSLFHHKMYNFVEIDFRCSTDGQEKSATCDSSSQNDHVNFRGLK